MFTNMRMVSLAALACTALLAGCGGDSEQDKVKQAFDDYVQAVKDTDGEKFCDSVASPELAEAPRDEREKEIELCKDGFKDETLSKGSDQLANTQIVDITVKGDQATANVTTTVNGKKESAKTRFLKVDGDWKVRFGSG